MNRLRTRFFPTLFSTLVLVLAGSQGMAGAAPGERVWKSPSAWEGGGSLAVGNHGAP